MPTPTEPYAPVTLVGGQVAEAMAPWTTTSLSWYLDAIGSMFEQVASMSYDVGYDDSVGFVQGSGYVLDPYVPGYGSIFDPETCETDQLPYLGQFVGVEVPVGTASAAARSLVLAEAGLARGTDASIQAAAQRSLAGTKTVSFISRTRPDGVLDAYWFLLIVRPSECPSSAALIAAVNSVKPAGILWALTLSESYTWAQATGTWAADTMTWIATSSTRP